MKEEINYDSDSFCTYLLPSRLIKIGFLDRYPIVRTLSAEIYCQLKNPHAPGNNPQLMLSLRELFEYISCVQFSIDCLDEIDSNNFGQAEQARYHSLSLVFFSQSTMDLLAMWIKEYYKLETIKNSNIAFHKEKMQNELKNLFTAFSTFFDKKKQEISWLSEYRNSWVHRIGGGAILISDTPAIDIDTPKEKYTIQVPTNPNWGIKNVYQSNIVNPCEDLERSLGKWMELDEFILIFGNNVIRNIMSIIGILFSSK